jgi:hypothetical protein
MTNRLSQRLKHGLRKLRAPYLTEERIYYVISKVLFLVSFSSPANTRSLSEPETALLGVGSLKSDINPIPFMHDSRVSLLSILGYYPILS